MSLTLFEETFIYGNLELVYNSSDVIKVDISSLKLFTNLTFPFIWRFFKNIKFILYSKQYIILQNYNESKIFFDSLFKYIKHYESKLNITNYDIEESITIINCFKCIVLTLLKEIESNFINLSDQDIKNYFVSLSNNYRRYYDQNFIIHYTLPYEENYWSPDWNLYINNKRFILNNIDIYLDNYFKNKNIIYNLNLNDNIKILYERLKNLINFTHSYKNYIFNNLNIVTKSIFFTYPLNIIFNDYKNLLEFENCFKPPILDNIQNIKEEDIWLLTILPENVRCYLLGIPIFSSGLISIKNQQHILNKITETSLESYYSKIYKKNKYIINHLLFDLEVGNMNDDDEEYVDISYNVIKKFNIDDIIISFNNGILHIFTCSEFKELIKKKQNFYNREPFNLIDKVNYNIKRKKDLILSLNNRHIDIKLDRTIEDNFNNIKHLLQSKDKFFIEKEYNNSILDIFFNPDFNFI